MTETPEFTHDTIAMVYDFDGTLSPQPMQEYTVLPKLDIKPDNFWAEVNRETAATASESMLVYMRLLIEKAEERKIHIGPDDFRAMGKSIQYFPGVEGWFDRINRYIALQSDARINVKHYIISAGIKEILEGTTIKNHFQCIYASEYHFDHHGVAKFPKLLITDTSKTQYLFRINKGKEDLNETINEHMPEAQRPIPFANMIYIGDGLTDVPSMAVARNNQGHSIAVYNTDSPKALQVCKDLLVANRAHFIAPADYREDSDLDKRVRLLLRAVITNIEYQRELFICRGKHGL